MTFIKWRLSQGTWEFGPEQVIGDRGGRLETSAFVDADGYRIGYLTEPADLVGLDDYDLTEITEAEALAFCVQLYSDAEVLANGRISEQMPTDDGITR